MKVLLIDDHPLIQAAVQSVISSLQSDVQVTGAESASRAREVLSHDAQYDLILLDLSLGDANGHDLLVEFRTAYPELPVVVLSASERTSDVLRSIDAGAMGFVSKRSSHDELIQALKTVMAGGLVIPQAMLQLQDSPDGPAIPEAAHHPQSPNATPGAAAADAKAVLRKIGLTPRQTDVLILLLKGLPNKLIARGLHLSVETVKDHVAAVLRALNVSTRTQAVLVVSQMMQAHGVFPGWITEGQT